ncbi:MAG TPA: hypothetical protein VF135_08740 [Terriglobales bacterium]
MNCAEVEYYGPLFHSGELEDSVLRQFQAHLHECADCQDQISGQQQLDAALRLASEEGPGREQEIRERVLAEIHKESVPAGVPIWWRPASLGIMAALLVLVSASGIFFYFQFRSSPQRLTIYRDAADDHRAEVMGHMNLTWQRDADGINALLERVGGTSELISRIAPAGFHLDRGRLCSLLSHRFVHLVYTNGSQEISYFVAPNSASELTGNPALNVNGKAIHVDTVQDLQVAGFQGGGFTVLLVSGETAREAIDHIASAAERF